MTLFPLPELLRPLQATAHHCALMWTDLLLVDEANKSSSEALSEAGVPDYRRASTRITGRSATRLDAERLDLAPGRPVLVIESVNTDSESVPVQCALSVFAADRVEIVVES